MSATLIGAAAAAIWLYLISLRGGFWRFPRQAPPPPAVRKAAVPAHPSLSDEYLRA